MITGDGSDAVTRWQEAGCQDIVFSQAHLCNAKAGAETQEALPCWRSPPG